MLRLYSFRNWLFVAHRLSGVILFGYFVAHIATISTALWGGPELFNKVMAALGQPAFRIVEITVVLCFLIHGINGLHAIKKQRLLYKQLGFRKNEIQ